MKDEFLRQGLPNDITVGRVRVVLTQNRHVTAARSDSKEADKGERARLTQAHPFQDDGLCRVAAACGSNGRDSAAYPLTTKHWCG